MGLKANLEWHEQKNGGWVARLVTKKFTRRYAHVNIFDWAVSRRDPQGIVPVQFQFYKEGYDVSWHGDIDSAKLHVEAIFALTYDETDSLIHWR